MRFSPQADTDTVTLIFNSHTVSITGKNLRELALAFQRMSVECVKMQPEHAGCPAGKRTAVIQGIQIQETKGEAD